eukprot:TRINITY_DN14181_c0_g1_i1.p1 TRINITY_DN14181_c0_g1~~TRINITY_DN14181_c0_g1_i1.p1  ORF type:complete len:289 (-),score=64.61 TRINITY_DN14181_c0_g1_i1:79-894(-)
MLFVLFAACCFLAANALPPSCNVPIMPLMCRTDIPRLAKNSGLVRHGAEVGVFQGEFSREILSEWPGKLYMIDAWQHRTNDSTDGMAWSNVDKNLDDAWHNANYNLANATTFIYAHRRKMIRSFSVPAAKRFPDGFFDFVFIDALHTYEASSQDIAAWYPKVKDGGILFGDDMLDADDERFRKLYPVWDGAFQHWKDEPRNRWGVRRAITEFAASHGHHVFSTYLFDCHITPAWFMLKCPSVGQNFKVPTPLDANARELPADDPARSKGGH